MDRQALQIIFSEYMRRFDELNDPLHAEYFKWIAAKKFKPAMDNALAAGSDDFAQKLNEARKVTSVLIDDSHTQPFYGLVKFAEKEPETVREMFQSLFAEDGGDALVKQDKIWDFITKSNALRDKYYYNSHLYTDTIHSVSAYMLLYDPDHNYLYKFSHGREFATLVEFGDDWGSGKATKLNVYYRMCNQLVEAMKQDSTFMEFNQTRYSRGLAAPEDMHPDLEKHILAFDMIYCTHTYGLGDEIDPGNGTPEQRKTALELFSKWEIAQEDVNYLNEAKDYVISIYKPGITIHHVTYGDGIIQNSTDTQIEVAFNEVGLKKLGTIQAAVLGMMTADVPGSSEIIESYRDTINMEGLIKARLTVARNKLIPYVQYLGKFKRKTFEESNT